MDAKGEQKRIGNFKKQQRRDRKVETKTIIDGIFFIKPKKWFGSVLIYATDRLKQTDP